MTRRRWRVHTMSCVLVLVGLPFTAVAQSPPGVGLIGLLEIPALHADPRADSAPMTPPVIRAAPSREGEILVPAEGESLQSHEWSYESPAAAVFGYRHVDETWYQVRLEPSGRPGWIAASPGTVFHPLSSLIDESLSYLTSAWDRRVYRTAGDPSTALALSGPVVRETPVAVAATARVGDEEWFLVVVLAESPCTSADPPAVRQAGWVPAHAPDGRLNLWFYSRGC